MSLETFGKVIMALGIGLALLGALVWLGGRLGLGSLPGDVRIERESWGCYVPIASSIVLSLVLTLVLNLIVRLLRK
ncbi:DUF2905 family protein [Coriobacteriia bacterium Es71-Z0120]|uniref:DUF2905 family protein n=1 Tax=Parvivirga hydrogeniphila TaxID=2939460 RepID=UPI002260C77D|nr:DUF2905 family protein [Parvivirga hydrogeniphila]MCL4079429.1 DUF2905 family protein [Parvivirga hydrogeniphila]